MGFLKRFRQWCKSRKQLKKLHNIGSVFHALNELEKGGMLSFDINNRRLFIEEPLALVMMTGGAKKWENFIGNCFVWLYHRQCSEAWDQYIKTEELDAVRVASKQYAAMTRADVERVRRVRRDEIMEGDGEQVALAIMKGGRAAKMAGQRIRVHPSEIGQMRAERIESGELCQQVRFWLWDIMILRQSSWNLAHGKMCRYISTGRKAREKREKRTIRKGGNKWRMWNPVAVRGNCPSYCGRRLFSFRQAVM